jgi:RNA polymerase sigma-70 factor (ECF subfamily)
VSACAVEPPVTSVWLSDGPREARPTVLGGAAGTDAERELVGRLRAGDDRVFAWLVDAYSPALLRVAQGYVPTQAVAEEVVQDTWLALVERLDSFEERCSIKTWLFRVVVNIARTRGGRERRTTPFCDLVPAGTESDTGRPDDGPTVDPTRFLSEHHDCWFRAPHRWRDSPEGRLVAKETLGVVRGAIGELPGRQRVVLTLRDVQGFSAEEVCEMLQVSPGNQRVLLHRARARVREALESYLDGSA